MIGLSARFLKVKQTYNITSISLLAYVAGVNGEGVGRAKNATRNLRGKSFYPSFPPASAPFPPSFPSRYAGYAGYAG